MAYGPECSMSHTQELSNNPCPEPNQPNSSYWYIFFLSYILILSSHLRLGFPKGLFPGVVPIKILRALLTYSFLARWSAHLSHLDVITLTMLGERYSLWSSSLWSLLHPLFLYIFGPNVRLRTLFSSTTMEHLFENSDLFM